jgi:hypothetical protein
MPRERFLCCPCADVKMADMSRSDMKKKWFVGPAGPETKIVSAGENLKQFTRQAEGDTMVKRNEFFTFVWDSFPATTVKYSM